MEERDHTAAALLTSSAAPTGLAAGWARANKPGAAVWLLLCPCRDILGRQGMAQSCCELCFTV